MLLVTHELFLFVRRHLVLMLRGGIFSGLYAPHVLGERLFHRPGEVFQFRDEFGPACAQAYRVVRHDYVAMTRWPCAAPDYRNQRLRYDSLGDFRGHGLEQNRRRSALL